jgi:hypothetical protein
MGLRPTQEDEKHATQSLLGFVSGHDFSRAVKARSRVGFSPCQGSRQELKAPGHLARGGTTKVVPDTKPEARGQPPKVHCRQNASLVRVKSHPQDPTWAKAACPRHSRRLFARLVKNLAQAIAYNELLTRLHGDGENTQLIAAGPANAEGLGRGLDAGQNAAGIFIGLYLNPRLARLQLLVALSHREAKLLFVPRDDKGREAV